MFRKVADFEEFERVMVETHTRQPIRILAYCVLSNQWQFIVWPQEDGQLTDFFRRLAHTHAMRGACRIGPWVTGTCIKDDSRVCPVQRDGHLLALLRHVEQSPLSAGLAECAQQWRWGSLWSRVHGEQEIKALLSTWPVKRPANWATRINTPLNAKELDRVRVSLERGRPYGGDEWVVRMVKELGLEHTVRPEGRPRKVSQSATDTTS